jgi:hypothetical protein
MPGMGASLPFFATTRSEVAGSRKRFSENLTKLDFCTQSCIVYTVKKKVSGSYRSKV